MKRRLGGGWSHLLLLASYLGIGLAVGRTDTHRRRGERMGVIRDLLIRATEKARHPQQARQFQNRHQCRREVGQRGGI